MKGYKLESSGEGLTNRQVKITASKRQPSSSVPVLSMAKALAESEAWGGRSTSACKSISLARVKGPYQGKDKGWIHRWGFERLMGESC